MKPALEKVDPSGVSTPWWCEALASAVHQTVGIWLLVGVGLAGCSSTPPPAAPPPALTQAGRHARSAETAAQQRNWTAALTEWQAAADQYRLLNRLPELAVAWHNAGQAHRHLNQFDQAQHAFSRAAELNRLLNQTAEWWRNQIALLQVEQPTDRAAHFQQLLPLFPDLRDPELAGHFLNELGLWQETTDPQAAEATYRQAEDRFRNNPAGRATALGNRARLQERAGDDLSAASLWQEARREFELAGDPWGITHALAGEGRALAAAGTELSRAKELLRRAAENYRTLGAEPQHTEVVRRLEELRNPVD